jgi:NADP-dependent 3-hydroxy acid dehydrogenase YdfG
MKRIPTIAMITGATSGIGRATAKLLAKRGMDIIITGRRSERLLEDQEKLQRKYGVQVMTLSFDIRDNDAVIMAYQSLPESWRKIDILINNAGLAKGLSAIHEGSLDHWETMIDTNIKGLLYMSRIVSQDMVARKGGHILNICSTAGHECYPNGNVYSATKYAVAALTKSMRLDLHKYDIRVSQVSPGAVEETEFATVRFDGDSERAKIYEDFTPLKSKDVAELIYFIVSRPSHVNIQDILVMSTQQASANHIDRSGRK